MVAIKNVYRMQYSMYKIYTHPHRQGTHSER